MTDLGIPFSLAFMAGAILRMRALSSAHDFAIVSKLAAETALKKGMQVVEAIDFGLGTLSEPPYLVWSTKRRRGSPRVGLDPTSPDQTELARREFGDAAEWVEVPSLQVIGRLRAREFDVTVWSRDVGEQEGVWLTEFSSAEARAAAPLTTQAVLVTAADDHARLDLPGERGRTWPHPRLAA
jgi:hypothetical protein